MNMPCDRWHDAILERTAGDLDPEGVARLERHLAVCPDCRAESSAWRILAEEARDALRLPAPSAARAMSKVLALTAATELARPSDPAATSLRDRASRPSLAWAPGLLALAACVALFLGLAGWLRPVSVSRQQASGPDGSLAPARGDAAAARGSGRSGPLAAVPLAPRREPRAAEPALHPVSRTMRLAREDAASVGGRAGRGQISAQPPAPDIVAAAALTPAPLAVDPQAPVVAPPRPTLRAEQESRPDRRTATPSPRPDWPTRFPSPTPFATSAARSGMARIAGKVEDPSGRPVVMALVYLRPADGGQPWGVVLTDTDDRGGFAVDLPPGRWELWVEAEGLQPLRYQQEPVLDLRAQQERTGILMRVSPPEPTSTPPSGALPPTPIAPVAPIAVAPILPTAAPTEDAPSR